MKSKKTLGSVLIALAVMLSLSTLAFGQEVTGSIVGTVKDTSGAVVPGATVTITDPSKDNLVVRTINTGDDGAFSAPNLASSTYNVTVEAPNFKKSVNTGIKLNVGERRLVEVALEAGRIDETVTVEADPVAVDTTSATNGTVISGEQVREIPINNRNFVQLVTLAPGVTNDLSDQIYTGTTAVGFENGNSATTAQASQPNTVQISVNGARSSQNTFTVDGADITDRGSNLTIQAYPSVDSIGEFRVLRSLYPAESGRSGGGQVNVITRSGTKDFRGSLYGFVRNEVFNANDFFSNQIAPVGRDEDGKAKRKPFRYLNAGWTLGGPIYFLKFGERDPDDAYFGRWDKTFFFFSQEFRRDRRSPTLFATMPYEEMRNGIFRVPICVQVTGGVCTETLAASPTNPLSLSTLRPINPVSQQYLASIYRNVPANTNATNFASPTAGGNFTLNYPTPNEADFQQEIFKIDHSFNEQVNMFYRYQRDKIPTLDANGLFSSGSGIPFVSTTETQSPGRTHTLQMNYVPSSNLIFEGRYTFGYGAIQSRNVGLIALDRSPIQPPFPYPNARDRVPSVSFAQGWSNIVGFGPYDNFSWKGNIAGTMTWLMGDHNMKFGAVYSKYRKNENAIAGNNEGLFSGFNTPGAAAATIATGGNTNQQIFANFLLGTNSTFTQARFDYTADLRQMTFEAFAQDEWRIRSNMTVYFGVRYSFFGSPTDRNGRLTNFVPELWNPAQAPAVTGAGNRVVGTGNFCNGIIVNSQNFQTLPNCTPQVSPWGEHVIDVPKNDFAPRVGIAWDPFKKGETSIRAGYGIYHEQVLNGPFLQNIGTNSPYQQTCTLTGINISNPDPGGLCTNPAFGFGIAQTIRSVQSDWETPYMQHWSLDLQQQLTRNTLVTVGYYGSKGTNLIGAFEMNLVPAGYAIERGATGCATGATYLGQTNPGPTLGPCQLRNAQNQPIPFVAAAASNILDQLRPFRGYRGITRIEPRFDSNYHSLQVSGQHRFSGSSQVNMAYTWGKNLTNSQNDRTAGPQNTYDVGLEWGRAALDRRHVFSTNFIYELPFYRNDRGFAGMLLGGWQASGIVTFQTGLALTPVTSNLDQAGLGIISPASTVARPIVLCDPNEGAPHTPQQWFNTSCFLTNAQASAFAVTRVGDAGRGIIEGPSTRRVDFTLAKNFNFTETFRLQLRAEVFNIFNWVNYRGIQLNITNAQFGQVISTRDPRSMQFGAKIYF